MVTINPGDRDDRGYVAGTAAGPSQNVGPRLTHEPERTDLTYVERLGYEPGIRWSGIIAGSLTTIALLVLSASLAYACGVPAYQGGVYGWGAGIWAAVTAIIAFFVGGMVACMGGTYRRDSAALYGFLTWALSVPLILLLSTTAGGFFRGFIAADVMRMIVQPPANQPSWQLQTGAAWGAFIALALGLIFALIAGASAPTGKAKMQEMANRTTT